MQEPIKRTYPPRKLAFFPGGPGLTSKNPGGHSDGPFFADLGFLARSLFASSLKPRDLRVDYPLDVLGLSFRPEGSTLVVRDNQDWMILADTSGRG